MAAPVLPPTKPIIIQDPDKLDEENWEWYTPESFYPISIGQVLPNNKNGRQYKVLYKIGYGTSSTIWICQDQNQDRYVCMKAMEHDYPSAIRELKAYELLSKEAKTTKLYGTMFVRKLLDHFQLRRGEHDYPILIHEPLGHDTEVVLSYFRGGRYPVQGLWSRCIDFARALEFIHSSKVVHADIQPKNILWKIGKAEILKTWENEEIANPSPRKYKGEWTIFGTKIFTEELTDWFTRESTPVLCDFGEAHSGQDSYEWESILPAKYRAPEIFLHMRWGSAVDIWSLGCMLWRFATGEDLFRRPQTRTQGDVEEINADVFQLATMAKLLTNPPPEFLRRSEPWSKAFFNLDTGSPFFKLPDEDNQTLEERFDSAFEDDKRPTAKESEDFINFIRRVLIWDPSKRPSASQLLKDPWIVEKVKLRMNQAQNTR